MIRLPADDQDAPEFVPRASIVTPTYRRPDLLAKLLDAATRQAFPPGDYEIVIADDAADDATREIVERAARESAVAIRYVAVTGVHGPAAARNAGWRAARGEVIAFTDDDCLPRPKWLAEGVRTLADGADAAWGRLVMPLPDRPTDYERDAAGLASAEFVTANCFVRRAALEAIGGFDERFRLAWREDSDLYFSLLEQGFRVKHAVGAVVVHPIRPAAWTTTLWMHRRNLYDALLFKKHPQLYSTCVAAMPTRYYLIGAAALVAAVGALLLSRETFLVGAITWLALTVEFWFARLRGASWSLRHAAETAVTSAIIPLLSLYYRVRGCLKFGVWFAP